MGKHILSVYSIGGNKVYEHSYKNINHAIARMREWNKKPGIIKITINDKVVWKKK